MKKTTPNTNCGREKWFGLGTYYLIALPMALGD
jgi:hypothetical protein